VLRHHLGCLEGRFDLSYLLQALPLLIHLLLLHAGASPGSTSQCKVGLKRVSKHTPHQHA
jgi:hypothetical protein